MGVASTPVPLTGANQAVRSSGNGVYRGFAIRETNGAVATVRIWDHATAASGTLLETIRLSANESAREWYADGGLWFTKGIFVEVVAGSVEGSVRIG